MLKERRLKYINEVENNSVSIFYSGNQKHKSADQSFPFVVDTNFYYLSHLDQSEVILVVIKSINQSKDFIFIEKPSELKALWTGETLSFDKAKSISEVDTIYDINDFYSFIESLFVNGRKALLSDLSYIYFDFEQYELTGVNNIYNKIKQSYPFVNVKDSSNVLKILRTQKDEYEINQMKEAININNISLKEVWKNTKQIKNEKEVMELFNYTVRKYAEDISFDTISASGINATTLHYVDNNSNIEDNSLILLDCGVYKNHYCSDITRTFPKSGKFSDRQKDVYEIVLKANKESIKFLKAGVTHKEFNDFGKKILAEGLIKIGLIKEESEVIKYYYHGLGHYLGLDVHDKCDYLKPIPEGAVITVEPGLYIKEWGIGIRIEDNVLVLKDSSINLSSQIVKEVSEIEKLIK